MIYCFDKHSFINGKDVGLTFAQIVADTLEVGNVPGQQQNLKRISRKLLDSCTVYLDENDFNLVKTSIEHSKLMNIVAADILDLLDDQHAENLKIKKETEEKAKKEAEEKALKIAKEAQDAKKILEDKEVK